jgi:hypothetical protein
MEKNWGLILYLYKSPTEREIYIYKEKLVHVVIFFSGNTQEPILGHAV